MSDPVQLQLGRSVFRCQVARTPSAHALGLSKHAELGSDEGMLFLFDQPGTKTFWMSSVRFPIDILGLDAESRVTRIVEGAQPGSSERWTFPRVAAVLEVPGGSCRRSGLMRGDVIKTVHTAAGLDIIDDEPIEDHPAHLTSEPAGGHFDEPKEEYFEALWGPDLAADALDVDDPVTRIGQLDLSQYEREWQQGKTLEQTLQEVEDLLRLQPVMRRDAREELERIHRVLLEKIMSGASRVAQIVDEAKFVEKMAQVLFGKVGEMQWTPDALNGGATERCVVTRRELAQWLGGEARNESLRFMLQAAASDRGLSLIGDAFILGGMADQARVGYANRSPTLILYRTRG